MAKDKKNDKSKEKSKVSLGSIDQAAAGKGKGIETLWQFIKFIVVSLGAFVIQTFLPLLIELFMSDAFQQKEYDIWGIFKSSIDDETGLVVGLGIFIAANVSNIIAQIVSFFINRNKTFNSDAKISVTLPIYIIFTVALIIFSAWLSTKLIPLFTGLLNNNVALATSISGACCGAVQFFLYFPVDKLLFPKKKEKKEDKEEDKKESKAAELAEKTAQAAAVTAELAKETVDAIEEEAKTE